MMEQSPLIKAAHLYVPPQVCSILRAIANFRREEQPELHAHVHPHGHATAKLARRFAAVCVYKGRTSDRWTRDVELGAYVHDIGKYLIASSIILKEGPLTREERQAICLHSIYGERIVAGVSWATMLVRQIVLHHHERWDGQGYPQGFAGTRIPLAARLVSITDVYTSLRARRSYKPLSTRLEACETLREMAGKELDPNLTEDFIEFIRQSSNCVPPQSQNQAW